MALFRGLLIIKNNWKSMKINDDSSLFVRFEVKLPPISLRGVNYRLVTVDQGKWRMRFWNIELKIREIKVHTIKALLEYKLAVFWHIF